jgi:hypothetical protein
MTHPAFAEMKASREAKLNSMVGKGDAHHELPSEKADRLAVKGDTYPSPYRADGGKVSKPLYGGISGSDVQGRDDPEFITSAKATAKPPYVETDSPLEDFKGNSWYRDNGPNARK